MKAVILAGGRGTRLAEESAVRPKPMVEIGGRPILWHIMKIYAAYGITDFVVCLGYKGLQIKEYFVNYRLYAADVSIDLATGDIAFERSAAEPWRVTLVDTGEDTQTGGRLKRIADRVAGDDAFCLTYGDGVADVDVGELIAFHRRHGRLATVTAVQPPGRFGALDRDGTAVRAFMEKPRGDGGTINGGFFVLSPRCLDRIDGDATVWEQEPLESLARDGELAAFDHHGFWQPMDTLRDRDHLERLWGERRCAVEGVVMRRPDPRFWKGRRVLVTGHTGFKGSWLTLMLTRLGATVVGIALPPEGEHSLFGLVAGAMRLDHVLADVCDPEDLAAMVADSNASLVLHLAAQALVQRGYRDPVGTWAVNLGGTIHLLQALRRVPGVEAALIVTTDKVYRNDGTGRRFVETDPLGGEDPYSSSKAAAELSVLNWAAAYAEEMPFLATARAGNVLGGGDFAEARLIPDIVRAAASGDGLRIRNPQATRPWQHVADVLTGYLLYLEDMVAKPAETPRALNFGPPPGSEPSVVEVLDAYSAAFGAPIPWTNVPDPTRPEAQRLALDPTLAARCLGWQPRYDLAATLASSARWYAAWRRGEDMARLTLAEVAEVCG